MPGKITLGCLGIILLMYFVQAFMHNIKAWGEIKTFPNNVDEFISSILIFATITISESLINALLTPIIASIGAFKQEVCSFLNLSH